MASASSREKGSDICPHHPNQKVVLECEDCSGTLVCMVCTTSEHRRHAFKELSISVSIKRERIQYFILRLDNESIPQLVQEIKSVEKCLQEIENVCIETTKAYKDQGEFLKAEIDIITANKISKLETVREENVSRLAEYKKRLQDLQKELEDEKRECSLSLDSSNDILVYDTETDIASRCSADLPKQPQITLPRMEPRKDPQSFLENAFGKTKEIYLPSSERSKCHETCPQVEPREADVCQIQVGAGDLDRRQMYKRLYRNSFITSKSNNSIWVGAFDERLVQLLFMKDDKEVVQRILLDVHIANLCLHPVTGQVYACCWSDSSIRVVKEHFETSVVFYVESNPGCMAWGRSGNNVLVGMFGILNMYSQTGDVEESYKGDFTPVQISVCLDADHIAVACGNKGVMIMNGNLQLLIRYGGVSMKSWFTSPRKDFISHSVIFKDRNHMLVADRYNKEIHIVDLSTGSPKATRKPIYGLDEVVSIGFQESGANTQTSNETLLFVMSNHIVKTWRKNFLDE